jgi:hypothetical protein
VPPGRKEFGPGGGSAPLRRSRNTLDRADQRKDGKAENEQLEHRCSRNGAVEQGVEGTATARPG